VVPLDFMSAAIGNGESKRIPAGGVVAGRTKNRAASTAAAAGGRPMQGVVNHRGLGASDTEADDVCSAPRPARRRAPGGVIKRLGALAVADVQADDRKQLAAVGHAGDADAVVGDGD